MYHCTEVRPPAAHGGRRGLGTVKALGKSIEKLLKEVRWKDPERREEERRRMKSDVRDLGFVGLKACGGLRDQVCIHQADRVASEIPDWSQRARKAGTPPDDPACTSVPRSASANRDQPTEERKSTDHAGEHTSFSRRRNDEDDPGKLTKR